MTYSLMTARQANAAMGWDPARVRAYWNARARACSQFADEGECLAQVARHVPVTIGGAGSGGLGNTTVQDVTEVLRVTSGLFTNPDQTLRTYGPPIVLAADQHVISPLMSRVGSALTPYVLKYVLPVFVGLYITTGISAYYSFKNYQGSQSVRPNRRHRRRRTSRAV
jgi:hypothetical protein